MSIDPVAGPRWLRWGCVRAGAWRLSLAALISAATFGVLCLLVVVHSEPLTELDAAGHSWLRELFADNPGWLATMAALTHLGDTVTVVALDLIVIAVLVARRRAAGAAFVAVAALLAWGTSRLVRELVARPRPGDRLWHVDGFAFPSGHATNSASTAAIIVAVCWPLLSRLGRICVVIGAIAYAATVAMTRVAGGVHWPSDVVGGVLVALSCVMLAGVLGRKIGGAGVLAADGPPAARLAKTERSRRIRPG
jgi:membrane-associated phospholipid phosphatase